MKLGILGTSEIAFRRFLPALERVNAFTFAGIASRDSSKTRRFIDAYGGIGYDGYATLLDDSAIDCVYIPLPPALHYFWAKKALKNGKHVMLEKPLTISLSDSAALVESARAKNLALHENYAFRYHSQIDEVFSKLPELGDLRLIRADFGFPFRGSADFRYDESLGGGALLDCGGYVLNLALLLLGESVQVEEANLGYKEGFDVDVYGSATLQNIDGQVMQVSFGMDNDYRCSLDIWGSKGSLFTDRIFTAPVEFEPVVTIRLNNEVRRFILHGDDSFAASIKKFADCILDEEEKKRRYDTILDQARIVNQFEAQALERR